jgi:hypothetical protein
MLGQRGRLAAPAPTSPCGVRGRVRPVAHSWHPRTVREPIPVHDARRSRPHYSASQAGIGGHLLVSMTAVQAAGAR